jgi:hypothetical protein
VTQPTEQEVSMTLSPSADKRLRAATLSSKGAAAPTPGNLDVHWDSPFDRLCYDVSASGMARKDRARYDLLLAELTMSTGCTEDEVITHGQKVRSMLYFAEDRLGREGVLARLVGTQQHPYRLAPVTMAF